MRKNLYMRSKKAVKNYPLYDYDRYSDFVECLDAIAEKYAESPAVGEYTHSGEYVSHSYAQLRSDIAATASGLESVGLGSSHIAVIGESSYLYVVATLAIIEAGGVAVTIDVEQAQETIADMLLRADCAAMFASPSVYELLTADPRLTKISPLLLGGENDAVAGRIERGAVAVREKKRPSPDAPAMIVYTSGTTSTSKPVLLSHGALVKNFCDAMGVVYIPRRVFNPLPLYHVYGFADGLMTNLVRGNEVCLAGNIKHMMRDMKMFSPQAVMSVPLITDLICRTMTAAMGDAAALKRGTLMSMFKHSERENAFSEAKMNTFPHLELVISGGAHLSEQTAKALTAFNITVLQGYGITECSPLVAVNRNKYNCIGSVGPVLPSYEIKLRDGEILVRGESLMSGYYNDEELTRESFEDGWYCTGDLGKIDSRGFLWITGRKKNVIVLKNGKKVSPEELEGYINSLPSVGESMVYASPTGAEADDVVPAVTIYPDPAATAGMSSYEILEQLQREIDRVNESLPPFKQIRVVNIRETEFPKTATKKIKR
jgi:long-chain acyl-CoA synthetase